MKISIGFIAFLTLLFGCVTIKEGESWKMRSDDKTIGLTLLWNLPEKKLKEMLPPDQMPRIQNGVGVLMLFLCSTEHYFVGQKKYGQLGVAHLIIPLKDAISIPETIGLKNQAIIQSLKKKGFPVRFGDVKLHLEEVGDSLNVDGFILFEKGEVQFSGRTANKKGEKILLENTKLVGLNLEKDILSGPEFYNPIDIKAITIKQGGENWFQQFDLGSPPNRIWINVDFGVDFKYSSFLPY